MKKPKFKINDQVFFQKENGNIVLAGILGIAFVLPENKLFKKEKQLTGWIYKIAYHDPSDVVSEEELHYSIEEESNLILMKRKSAC